jgi:tetratricopeptide (TPR) repeat protein
LTRGDQSAHIGGSADHNVIITGDHNQVEVESPQFDQTRQRVEGDEFQAGRDLYVDQRAVHIHPAAPTSAVTPLYELPAPPGDFTGREAELAELVAHVEAGGVTISGLRGMSGIGKTALALKVAEQIKVRYPDAQFYLDLKGTTEPLSPSQAMEHVIRAYHPTAKLPESEDELHGLYLSVLEGKRALLLMDNARDAGQVKPLVPPAGCCLLVTSRWHFALKGWHALDLNALPEADAQALLLKLASRIGDSADRIAALCGRLPLALCLAGGALAARENLSVQDYIRQLEDSRQRLKQIDKYKEYTNEELGVEASLDLSYRLLKPDLQERWRALSVFPGSFNAPAAAAVWAGEPAEAKERLGDLLTHSLVEWEAAGERYRLHDLARDFADSKLDVAERTAAQRHHAEHYLSVLRSAKGLYKQGHESVRAGLALFDLERPNIEAGQRWAAERAGNDDLAARICCNYPDAGVYCLNLRQHPRKELIPWREAALDAARRLKDRAAEGAHLGNLGNAYTDLGETRRAIEFHEQFLVIAREIGDRLGEGNVLGNLGIAYAALGETRKAIEYHEKALAISREIGDRRSEGQDLGNLGLAYAALGETRRAVEFYEQQLTITREIGDRHGEGNALGNLGIASRALGETRRAIEFYEQYLAIAREIGDRRGEGNALGNLGNAYNVLGEPRRAIEFYEQQLTITREIGDRRGEGNALWNMALAWNKLNERAKAIPLVEQALTIYEQIEDPHAPEVRQALERWRAEG